MKKVIVFFALLLISIGLLAQRPHQVVVGVVMSDGTAPTGESPEEVSFTGDLYRSGSIMGSQVTQSSNDCFYYEDGGSGVVWIEVYECLQTWDFGDVLKIVVTCDGETGHAQVVIGSIGDNKDEVPAAQSIQLLETTLVTLNTSGQEVTQNLTKGDFALTPTGTGTANVSAPANDFSSIPGLSRADNIDQCFSVEFTSGITELATSFSWESTNITGNMSDKDLLVSVDGVNWIYSDNFASGITGDVEWDFDDTPDPDEMTVSFTTTQDNALYAVSNGTDPEVTTPNAPSGGTASESGGDVTISCRAVAVPGATYQVYYSSDFSSWNTTGDPFTASSGTALKTVTHSMGANNVMYYGIKAYNDNTSYLSPIGKTIYTYQKNSFITDTGNMTNLIPFPYDGFNNNFDSASELGTALGSNCNAIVKWNASNQIYSYCTYYNSSWSGDFDLTTDGVYFVNLTGSVSSQTYDGVMNKSDFNLKTGINLIYVSALDSGLSNASDLMNDIGVHCTKVQQWDTINQGWDTYTSGRDDFTLTKLNPVFVYVDADVTYTK